MPSSISTGAVAQRASSSPKSPCIELPNDVWALIGSHLGARDLARASTVIKALCGVQPVALNLAHTLTEINKVGELVWGLKRSGRVLSAAIGLRCSQNSFYEVFLPKVLEQARNSFPCIQELSLDVRSALPRLPVSVNTANAFGRLLLGKISQLQLLELRAHVLVPFPVMPRLRHLSIMLDGKVSLPLGNAVESIAALPALQTLHCEVVMPHDPDRQTVIMDLRRCVSLQAVRVLGMTPHKIWYPGGAKLTLDMEISELRVHSLEIYVKTCALRLSGHSKLWYLLHKVDTSMLSALSLHDVKNSGNSVVKIHLGENASQLRFLLVTCSSKNLHLNLSLPCLSTLVVHAADSLELNFDEQKNDTSKFDAVSIRWKCSTTMQAFKLTLRAHCRKKIFAGVVGDPDWPELIPRYFVRTEGFGKWNNIHPCTVASGACGACLEHCCPREYPVPQP